MNVEDLSILPPWEWPPEADAVILDALRGEGASDSERLIAAEMASSITVHSDAIAHALLDLIRDPDRPEDVRATAAISLGPLLEELEYYYDDEFEELDPRPVTHATERAIRDGLRDAHYDPEVPTLVRRQALEASVRAIEEWHERAIREALERDDRDWSLTAVFAMGWVDGFEDEIVEALGSDDSEVRLEAVLAAGRARVEAAWPDVRRLLDEGRVPRPLLLAAIEAAPSVGPPEEVTDRLIVLTDSDDEEIAETAEEALGMSGLWDDEMVDPDDPFDDFDPDFADPASEDLDADLEDDPDVDGPPMGQGGNGRGPRGPSAP